jgi:hypothetical protein
MKQFRKLTLEQSLEKQQKIELRSLVGSIINKAKYCVKIAKKYYLPFSGIASLNYDQPNQRVFPNQDKLTLLVILVNLN